MGYLQSFATKRRYPMARFTISKKQRQRLQNRQALAEKAGDIKTIMKIAAILLFFEQDNCLYNISTIFGKSEKCILNWVKSFMVKGLNSLKLKWSRGRPSKLDRDKLAKLKIMITEGPQSFGYPEGCWNCAMIVDLILKTWEITYSAKYLPQLLKRLGLSY